MSKSIYQIKVGDDVRMTFEGNFAEASSQLTIGGDSTPYQVADARHSPSKAAEMLNEWCRSEGGEAVGEDEEYEVVAFDAALDAMVTMLNRHGSAFTGNNVEDEAGGWIEHGFDADDADEWCEIGCWDSATAAEFRDAGKTPAQIETAAKNLIAAEEDEWNDMDDGVLFVDRDSQYTVGDPIYSACNNDTPAQELIDACE